MNHFSQLIIYSLHKTPPLLKSSCCSLCIFVSAAKSGKRKPPDLVDRSYFKFMIAEFKWNVSHPWRRAITLSFPSPLLYPSSSPPLLLYFPPQLTLRLYLCFLLAEKIKGTRKQFLHALLSTHPSTSLPTFSTFSSMTCWLFLLLTEAKPFPVTSQGH